MRERAYTMSDGFGPFMVAPFRKLPHALRQARKRARLWSRELYVNDGQTVWVVRPNLQITRCPSKP